MKTLLHLSSLAILLMICQPLEAQFKGLTKALKIVEDELADKVAEEAAEKTIEVMDDQADKIWREQYREKYGVDLSDDELDSIMIANGETKNGFLANLDASDRLPDSYTFKKEMVVEYTDKKGKTHQSTMYFSDYEAVILSKTEKEDFTIMDLDRDIITTYMPKNMTAMAMGGMMETTAVIASSPKEVEDKWEIRGPLTTKRILGHSCQLYEAESDEYLHKYYLSDSFGQEYAAGFEKLTSKYSYGNASQLFHADKGLTVEGTTLDKRKNKTTSFRTISLEDKEIKVNNSEYNFSKY